MLAARGQENVAHGHHTAAAAKPLNQGTKYGPPKTPSNIAPKTPFKIPLNDENATVRFGGKGKATENGATGAKQGRLGDNDAFITPLGPRNRAPLGMKTTNAKAKAFQTPAQDGANGGAGKGKEKSQQKSASARRLKPRVSHVEPTKVEPLDGSGLMEEDIEYMPPKPVDLPDHPEDFPPDMEYPQFANGNLTRGLYSTYLNPVDGDGVTLFSKREEEQSEKVDRELDAEMERMLDEMPLYGYNVPEYAGAETILGAQQKLEAEQALKKKKRAFTAKPGSSRPLAPRTTGPSRRSPLSTASKASALQPKTVRQTINASKPAPTSSLRKPVLPSKPKPAPAQADIPYSHSPMRHAAATAASRTTIGYSKGRVTSSAVRPSIKRMGSSSASGAGAGAGRGSGGVLQGMMTYKGAPALYTTEEWERLNRESLGSAGEKGLEASLKGMVLADPQDEEEEESEYEI